MVDCWYEIINANIKKIAENTSNAGFTTDLGNTGCKPTENEILAVRGVANNGPKVK